MSEYKSTVLCRTKREVRELKEKFSYRFDLNAQLPHDTKYINLESVLLKLTYLQ